MLPPSGPGRAWWALHLWQIQCIRDALLIASVIALVWLGYAMRSVTTPLLVALGLAYLFEPVVGWVTRRWGISRTVTVSSLILLLVGGVIVALALTAPLVIRQATSLLDDVRSGRLVRGVERLESVLPEAMRDPFRQAAERLGLAGAAESSQSPSHPAPSDAAAPQPALVKEAESDGREHPQPGHPAAAGLADSGGDHDLNEHIRRVVREELLTLPSTGDPLRSIPPSGLSAAAVAAALRSGWDTAGAVMGFLLQIGLLSFLIPFYFFFFSVSYPKVQTFAASLIPQRGRERTLELLREMDAAVAGFVRGRVVISAIVGFILAVGWLGVGVPYSIVLGIVVGVFNLVPYLSSVGLPLAVGLMVFAQLGLPEGARDGWLWTLGAPTAVFAFAQFLDGYVLTPLIAGKATNLDPVTIFVAVLAGGSIGGVYGMLLAIPVAACLKIILREVLFPRIKQWVEGRASDPLPM
jgi:predicted PurR-regulated permease PerM